VKASEGAMKKVAKTGKKIMLEMFAYVAENEYLCSVEKHIFY